MRGSQPLASGVCAALWLYALAPQSGLAGVGPAGEPAQCEGSSCAGRAAALDGEDASLLQRSSRAREPALEAPEAASRQGRSNPKPTKPHVVFLLADDYGWGNLGYHRRDQQNVEDMGAWKQAKAEVHTPNLDRLIDNGLLLDQHYAYKICAPSRASLQSGRLAVHVNVVNGDIISWNPNDNISGFEGIPRNMTGMAQKMKAGGYKTHLLGKWDVGLATPQHTPWGRGYDTWLGFYQHANDYWDESCPMFDAMGKLDICENRFVDFSFSNESYRGPVTELLRKELGCEARSMHLETIPNIMEQVNATGCSLPEFVGGSSNDCLPDSCYLEAMLNARALTVIKNHDTLQPLFLFYSFHLVHSPLQVPDSYLKKLDHLVEKAGGRPIDDENRRLYAAMTLYMDDMVGRVVAALQDRGMYDDTLIVFTSDNGGPVYEPGAANNHPLKSGKYSDFGGGVRTNAFVSGGYVPAHRRGKVFEGVISIADWYATLSSIAGVDYFDYAANAASAYQKQHGLLPLPPVDGRPQWHHMMSGTNGREDPLHLSLNAVLRWPFKLVTGSQMSAFYQGEVYPNCSTTVANLDSGPVYPGIAVFGMPIPWTPNMTENHALTYTQDCGEGCLYNVLEDPTEHQDLAGDPAHADILRELQQTLAGLNVSFFNPDRGAPVLRACNISANLGGFYSPFVDAESYYLGLEPLSSKQQQVADQVMANLTELNANMSAITDKDETVEKIMEMYPQLKTMLSRSEPFDQCLGEAGDA